MNFSQKFGLFILILISIAYVYYSFFHNNLSEIEDLNPLHSNFENSSELEAKTKNVKIFLLNNLGELKPVNRECNLAQEDSCIAFAFQELLSAPTKLEKAQGFTSEIPIGTKILSIRESKDSAMIDLSNNFEIGGGAESTYMRIRQIIKTANANTSLPTYLYINGKQANVIGGEGIMIKQPLSERSFDE